METVPDSRPCVGSRRSLLLVVSSRAETNWSRGKKIKIERGLVFFYVIIYLVCDELEPWTEPRSPGPDTHLRAGKDP